MKYICQKLTSGILLGTLLLSGCAASTSAETVQAQTAAAAVQADVAATATPGTLETLTNESTQSSNNTLETEENAEEEYFSARDLSGEYDTSEAVEIILSGSSIHASSDCVSITGSTATITAGGTYILSGSLDNGSIIVDVSKDEKVQLVLSGATIHSETFAAIYIKQSDKVFLTLAEGTDNVLSNGGNFTQIDDTEVDAVIFSKDDLTLNGSGSLTVSTPVGHGVVGKDEITITGGSYAITASKSAIRANDSIAIADGSFRLSSNTDCLHAEDNDDDSAGSVYIAGGSFSISAGNDGIRATTTLTIAGGSFTIQAAEGLESTMVEINDGTLSISASDDGINAARKSSQYSIPTITINGGTVTIVMGGGDTDGVDANGNIIINGGTIDVTGNSTFDYDGTASLNGGTVIVNGQQVTSLPNQTFGGMGGGRPGGMDNGQRPGGMGGKPGSQWTA